MGRALAEREKLALQKAVAERNAYLALYQRAEESLQLLLSVIARPGERIDLDTMCALPVEPSEGASGAGNDGNASQ